MTGALFAGSVSALPVTAGSAESTPESVAPVPAFLNVWADRQYTDPTSHASIAEGNVSVQLGDAELRADRIEFDANYRTLYARGNVRYRRGKQYFQASNFRYNLAQELGQLNDVYGVLDLEEPLGNPLTTSRKASAPPETPTPPSREGMPAVACPPLLPPVPDWHPQPWAVTAWGGQMIDASFGDTFLFNGRMRPEAVLGIGLQKRIMRAGPLAFELGADLFSHIAKQQEGGEFNQSSPYADLPAQSFGEAVIGVGARIWVQPWLNFSVIEGVSYNTNVSLYEKTFRENYTQLLNYLAFEVEAAVSSNLSLVGRIHHRSGAFGTYAGVSEGSNGYLLGLRYRWGRDIPKQESTVMPPLPECEDPDRELRVKPSSLSDRLDSIALGDGGEPQRHVSNHGSSTLQSIHPAQQEDMRTEAIAKIDQRISDVSRRDSFSIEQRSGIPTQQSTSEEVGFIGLPGLGNQGPPLVEGTISRWRIQAAKVSITRDGWKADRMGFSNDPFTPAQTRIDAEDVVAREQANGDVLITARRNRLIIEDRLPIPVQRRQLIEKEEEEVTSRWVLGIDNEDRDGFYIGRYFSPIPLVGDYSLSLQPQLLVQRAYNGETDSYPDPDALVGSRKVNQPTKIADLFGLEAELNGSLLGWDAKLNADISTFNPENFSNGSRYWASIEKDYELPWIGEVTAELFGAYRYRTWNGSLGETDVYRAMGGFVEQKKDFRWGELKTKYIWRVGLGNYDAESYTESSLTENLRANFYGRIKSTYPIWEGEYAALTPQEAFRYSPQAIRSGLYFSTNLSTLLAAYGDGVSQSTVTLGAGPTLVLGTFSKPWLDYTKLGIYGSVTYRQGVSPFAFDQAVDLGAVGVNFTQQILGPLVFKGNFSINVDSNSEYYRDVIGSNFELTWQRRSYDFGFFFNPNEGQGGVRFRLHDMNYKGTGVPFVPYNPTNWMETTNTDRPF